jgi:hypothetical protein
MKKLLCAATALVVFSMLAPSASMAEPTHPNEVGLYMAPNGYGATGTFVIGDPVEVYLVLTKPTDTVIGTPYASLTNFECNLNFEPRGYLVKLGETFLGDHLNIGNVSSIGAGFLQYIVQYVNDEPVIDESIVLVQISLMHTASGVIEVTLGPIGSYSSIPGQMSFISVDNQYEVMHPVSGSHDTPVFLFGGEAVAVEQESLGSVKALYR